MQVSFKKAILLLFTLTLILPFFTLISTATDDDELTSITDQTDEDLFDIIEDEVADTLEDFGISSIDSQSIYNISLSSITAYFATDLSQKAASVVSTFFNLFSVVLILSILTSIFKGSDNQAYISIVAVIIMIILMVDEINTCVNTVVSVLSLSSSFMLSFIPIYTLLISLSGNPTSALTYNSLVFVFAQCISFFANYFAQNIMGAYFCLSIAFCMNEAINIGTFVKVINKCVNFSLGLIATIFTSFLSIKNVLSIAIDSVSVKGIRFLISSLIPVVGGAISDAYSSILGSLSLIKSSVAIIGILVITILNVPVIIETLLYYIALSVLTFISDALDLNSVSNVLKCFSTGIRILLLLLVFQMFILIISTGIMVAYNGGS